MTEPFIVWSHVEESLDVLYEVAASQRAALLTRSNRRKTERFYADLFLLQADEIIAALEDIKDKFDEDDDLAEAVTRSDWMYLLDLVFGQAKYKKTDFLVSVLANAHAGGSRAFDAELSKTLKAQIAGDFPKLSIVFDESDPRAVKYASERAAELVTKIEDTTRKRLNRLLTQAVDESWAWDKTRDAIRDRFTEFSIGRAKMIARYEIGDAYEAGRESGVIELTKNGWEFEKAWLNAGDHKVRPEHIANAADGWILFSAMFSSGHSRPPTDGGCRCTAAYRKKRA